MSKNSTTTSKVQDNLLAGITHRVTKTSLELTAPGSDKTYARGTVMALDTVTGKLVPYVSGGSDGAGTFYGILAQEEVFLTADSDKASTVVFETGQFNSDALTFEGAGDVAGIEADARLKGCFFESIYNADSIPPA